MATLTVKQDKKTNRITVSLKQRGREAKVETYDFESRTDSDIAMQGVAKWALERMDLDWEAL